MVCLHRLQYLVSVGWAREWCPVVWSFYSLAANTGFTSKPLLASGTCRHNGRFPPQRKGVNWAGREICQVSEGGVPSSLSLKPIC